MTPVVLATLLGLLLVLPGTRSGATHSDYSDQAEAQHAADSIDADTGGGDFHRQGRG